MFFCLPARVKQTGNNETIPLVNVVLIAINILAFVFYTRIGRTPGFGVSSAVSYAFVHCGLWHLLVNMWVLWVFGHPVNRRLGNMWYLLVYLGSATIIGVLVRLLAGVDLVGASGAVFAVIAACLILMPAAVIEILVIAVFPLSLLIGLFARPGHWIWWFVRYGRFHIRALWGLLIVPIMEISGLLFSGWNWTNLGHLLGLACGVAAVLMLPRRISMKRHAALGS